MGSMQRNPWPVLYEILFMKFLQSNYSQELFFHTKAVFILYSLLYVSSINTVIPILKKNFVGLCRCLPEDYIVTLERLKTGATVDDGLALDLSQLSSADERNEMIIALMLKPLKSDVQVLGFCDLLEVAVDSVTSKKFVHNLRAGMNPI